MVFSVLSQLEGLWQQIIQTTIFLLTGPQRRKSMLDPTNILKGKTEVSVLASPQKISGITCRVNFFPPQKPGFCGTPCESWSTEWSDIFVSPERNCGLVDFLLVIYDAAQGEEL